MVLLENEEVRRLLCIDWCILKFNWFTSIEAVEVEATKIYKIIEHRSPNNEASFSAHGNTEMNLI